MTGPVAHDPRLEWWGMVESDDPVRWQDREMTAAQLAGFVDSMRKFTTCAVRDQMEEAHAKYGRGIWSFDLDEHPAVEWLTEPGIPVEYRPFDLAPAGAARSSMGAAGWWRGRYGESDPYPVTAAALDDYDPAAEMLVMLAHGVWMYLIRVANPPQDRAARIAAIEADMRRRVTEVARRAGPGYRQWVPYA